MSNYLLVFQESDGSLGKPDQKNLVSGLEHLLDLVIRMDDDIFRRDRELLGRLAARTVSGIKGVLAKDYLNHWMDLAVERGVGQDVAPEIQKNR